VKERVWPLCGVAERNRRCSKRGAISPEHPAELAVLAEGRRHEVVAFVHDQQVPWEMGRSVRGPARGKKLFPYVRLPEVVVGRDDPAERAPRVGVDPEPAAQLLRRLAVDHLEGQRELLPELLPPLVPERGGGENENAADAAPKQ